nr:MAG TPA: hypothetical protein [Bacteriophage sp.]
MCVIRTRIYKIFKCSPVCFRIVHSRNGSVIIINIRISYWYTRSINPIFIFST